MNQIQMANFAPTMTSKEIAVLTEKEHKNVLRDIDSMFESLEIDPEGYAQNWAHPQNGQIYRVYALPEDLTLTLVSGYNAKLRLKIIQRWRDLEAKPESDPFAKLPPEQRALVAVMLDNADIKRVQQQQAESIAMIERRVEESAQHHLMLARPTNSESIVHIRERINKKYGLPARIVDAVMRQSLYAPKPAGMVKNAREEAQGASYAVYWTKDINSLFSRFASECEQVTATQARHPLIEGRFKLNKTAERISA